MVNKQFYSLPEVAQVLGISRIAVYKQVISGKISAQRMGRGYFVSAEYLGMAGQDEILEEDRVILSENLHLISDQYITTLIELSQE